MSAAQHRWLSRALQGSARLCTAIALSAVLGGCGDSAQSAVGAKVVIGVSVDKPLIGAMDQLVLVVTDETGATIFEQARPYDGSGAIEFNLPPVADNAPLRATVMAFAPGSEAPLIRRIVETRADVSRTLLVRVRLNDECLPKPGERDVSCSNATCSAGICVLPFVSPHLLEDYSPDWSIAPTGHCGPVDEGDPIVSIGSAQPPFTPLSNGDIVTPQMGLQGASHFFFAVRMQNADDGSVLTHYYGSIVETGRETSVVSVADKYVVNADGCELFSVPLILPPEDVTGQTMRLGVTVSDITGNAGHSHVDIELAAPLPP